MFAPPSQDLVLVGLLGLLVVAVGVRYSRSIREFLLFVRDALIDEWNGLR